MLMVLAYSALTQSLRFHSPLLFQELSKETIQSSQKDLNPFDNDDGRTISCATSMLEDNFMDNSLGQSIIANAMALECELTAVRKRLFVVFFRKCVRAAEPRKCKETHKMVERICFIPFCNLTVQNSENDFCGNPIRIVHEFVDTLLKLTH
jgi:hypothetical protein